MDANEIVEVITDKIAPKSWAKAGGKGTLDFYPLGKTLVVSQTPDHQEQVKELIEALRRGVNTGWAGCCGESAKCCDDGSKCAGKCCAESDCCSACSKQAGKQTDTLTRIHQCEDLLDHGCPDSIIDLILNHIRPAAWSRTGGNGTIDYYPLGKSLVVTQTADIQEQIAEFLQALRRVAKHDAAAPCTEADSDLEDWAMQFMPCPDPAFFMPWAMFSQPMMAMLWNGAQDGNNEGTTPSPFRLAGLTPSSGNCDPEVCPIIQAGNQYTFVMNLCEAQHDGQAAVHKLQHMILGGSPCQAGINRVLKTKDGTQTITGHTTFRGAEEGSLGLEIALNAEGPDSKTTFKTHFWRTCSMGKKRKVVLQRNGDGQPQRWLELSLTSVPQSSMTGVGVNSDAGLTGCIIIPNAGDWRFSTAPAVVAVVPPMSACCPAAGTANPVCPPPVATAVPPPMPYCLPASTQVPVAPPAPPVMQCVAVETVPAARETWTMRTVHDGDKSKLSLGCCNDAKMCCDQMELKANGCGSVCFAPKGNQVVVSCNVVQALADCVNKTENGVQLKGHVRMCTFAKDQCHLSCLMDEAEISWKDGRMHFQCSWPKSDGSTIHAATPLEKWVGQ
jgi:hypothetical protein